MFIDCVFMFCGRFDVGLVGCCGVWFGCCVGNLGDVCMNDIVCMFDIGVFNIFDSWGINFFIVDFDFGVLLKLYFGDVCYVEFELWLYVFGVCVLGEFDEWVLCVDKYLFVFEYCNWCGEVV